MRLFWRHGYEGVSVSDLTTAMGIAAPSLYAAFGSKALLYREALERYEASTILLRSDAVVRARNPPEAVRALLLEGVAAVTGRGRERGCMVSDGLVACGGAHRALAADLARRRRRLRVAIARRLECWMGTAAAGTMARLVATLLQGLSIQARDGASAAELGAVVELACGGLEGACRRAPRPSASSRR